MKSKRLVLFMVLGLVLASFGCVKKPMGGLAMEQITLAANPKVGAYWTSSIMDEDAARKLARFHLVIADMENLVNNRASLELLKRLNPGIKLLAYFNPMELFVPMVANRPLQLRLLEAVERDYPGWFLKRPDGRPLVFWQGMRMMNLSSFCSGVNGKDWAVFAAEFLLAEVLSDPVWDGYFMDNSGGNVSWIGNGEIDADNDGLKDDPAELDDAWSAGIRKFLTAIRKSKGPDFILVGNKGSLEFLDLFNGKMFEEFPNDYLGDKAAGGWHQGLDNYFQTGPYSIIQTKSEPNLTFGLASALLGNGYFIYGQDFNGWFEEYRELGRAVGENGTAQSCFLREYESGLIKVWPEQRRGIITRR